MTAPPAPAEPPSKTSSVPAGNADAVPHGTDPVDDHLSESMAELDQFDSPEPEPPPKPVKPAATKPTEPAKKTQTTEPDPKPPKAAELRVAYEKTKETLKERDARIKALETELKTTRETPREDPEKQTLLGKLQAEEKRRTALEEKLRLVDYQQSDEFVKNYTEPYNKAWQRAASEIQELTIELEDGSTRPATVQDLVALSSMKLGEARKYAKQMFGDGSDEVMAHLRKLRELSDAQQTALAEAKSKSEAHFKQHAEQSLQERQKVAKLWKDENSAWTERYPRFFAPKDGDDEGNALLAKGYAMADKAFSTNGQASPEERVKLHAEMRNKAAGFSRVALELKRARTRIKELETSLAAYEESEPPAGEGGKPRPPKEGDPLMDAMSELDTIDK